MGDCVSVSVGGLSLMRFEGRSGSSISRVEGAEAAESRCNGSPGVDHCWLQS